MPLRVTLGATVRNVRIGSSQQDRPALQRALLPDDTGLSHPNAPLSHMPVVAAPPVIHFRARDFAIQVDGTPRAGEDLMIDYELAVSPSPPGLQRLSDLGHRRLLALRRWRGL